MEAALFHTESVGKANGFIICAKSRESSGFRLKPKAGSFSVSFFSYFYAFENY